MTHHAKQIADGVLLLATGVALRHIHLAYGKETLDSFLSRWNVKRRVGAMMHWPFIWPLAVAIGKTQIHNETGLCLQCLADGRLAEEKHLPKDTAAYIVVCGKCGLPKNRWGKRCKGPPKFVRQPSRQPRQMAKPAFWE